MPRPETIITAILVIIGICVVMRYMLCTVKQNTMLVLTIFGKYSRCLGAGLHLKAPWEKRYSVCSLQTDAETVDIQAVTKDQANVRFKAMIIYSVIDDSKETIKNAVFKFTSQRSFMRTLTGLTEGELRSDVAKHSQQDILGIREELSSAVMMRVNAQIGNWGYIIHDLQITDLTFDQAIMESMSKVVEAQNKMKAAENEGLALLIQETKQAEAKGRAMEIQAEAEKKSMKLRGEGIAEFREQVTKGISASVDELIEKGIDPEILTKYMYMETLKEIAEKGEGHIIFVDKNVNALDYAIQTQHGLDYKFAPRDAIGKSKKVISADDIVHQSKEA